MNNTQIDAFRAIASAMSPGPHDWQWVGKHMSQRMFGITQARAQEYAERFGGCAERMPTQAELEKRAEARDYAKWLDEEDEFYRRRHMVEGGEVFID
jgi:hypothetical protein